MEGTQAIIAKAERIGWLTNRIREMEGQIKVVEEKKSLYMSTSSYMNNNDMLNHEFTKDLIPFVLSAMVQQIARWNRELQGIDALGGLLRQMEKLEDQKEGSPGTPE